MKVTTSTPPTFKPYTVTVEVTSEAEHAMLKNLISDVFTYGGGLKYAALAPLREAVEAQDR